MDDIIKDCIAPDRHPRKPDIVLPKGSVDTHVHIFDQKYKLSTERGYNPPDSTLADLDHLHEVLGIDRVVFTQPSVYGTDNSAILDGMMSRNSKVANTARAVVAVDGDVKESELEKFESLGVRGIRLNTDNKGGMPVDMSDIGELAEKIKDLGWHFEFLFPGKDILELMPTFKSLPIPMSIGHFAYQPATSGIDASGFKALLELAKEGNTWIKISGANRVSETDLPPYDDVKPMAQKLIDAAPERIMWGTDWPHPNKYEVNPNDGDLVNAFGEWVQDEAMRQKIMTDNPGEFYRF